jgi:hypothetical protein
MKAGLMEEEETGGLVEEEREELNKLLNIKAEEPKKKETVNYAVKIKNLLYALADLL